MSNESKDKVQDLVVKFEVEGQEIKLTKQIVQEYIVGTDAPITNQEFKLFTELCKVRKLNPFLIWHLFQQLIVLVFQLYI